MGASLQAIFAKSFDDYVEGHSLSLRAYQAAHAIRHCRTDVMGGHLQHCPEGHVERIQYHSCRHRSCPQCAALPKARFAEASVARLLPCDHHHVIFTLPHTLNDLWSCNRKILTDTVMSSARDTLMTLMQDPRHLGATPGIVLSLHTWGRTLSRHPHVHCLVTAGGLDANGTFKRTRNDYLLPVRVVKALYRGKLLASLWRNLAQHKLRLPRDQTRSDIERLFHSLATLDWNVRIERRYAHGRGVLRYLARYVKGGPIDNRRLLRADGDTVRFRYKDHRDQQTKTLALKTPEFISRVLWHVPEPRLHTVRYAGLYAPTARDKRNRVRIALGETNTSTLSPLDWQTFLKRLGRGQPTRCSVCGHDLVRGGAIARRRGLNSLFIRANPPRHRRFVQQVVVTDTPTRHHPSSHQEKEGDIFLRHGAPQN